MYKFISILFVLIIASSTIISGQSTEGPNPKALSAMSSGNFNEAIRILDKDIHDNKNLGPSYILRGDIKKMTGDFPGALADLDKAIALNSNDGSLYQRRAELRMIVGGDMTAVLGDLDMAIAYGIKHEKVYSLRGMIRTQTGDFDGAIADYQNALGLRPVFAQAYVGLAMVYIRKDDSEKAIQVLEDFTSQIENSGKSAKTVKGNVTAATTVDVPQLANKNMRVEQGTVIISDESRSGGPPSPEEINRKTDQLEQSKNTAGAYTTLASLYDKRGEHEKALAAVQKGLVIDPTDFYGYETSGRIKLELEDYEGAVTDLSRSISIMPNTGIKYLDRGIALLLLGKDAEAQKDFDKYIQLYPANRSGMEKRIEEAKNKRSQQLPKNTQTFTNY